MNQEETGYRFRKIVPLSVDAADARVREELQKEGFGVLTTIDVEATLREKLGVDFRPYRILGACDPEMAHRALSEEMDLGVLLPCNVVVYEGERPDESVVSVLDPVVQLGVSGREDVEDLARAVRARMERVLEAV